MSDNFKRTSVLIGLAIAFIGGSANAQIEEVIVTANKREQTLQDIPMSVSVTSAEQIEQSAIVDLIDLL